MRKYLKMKSAAAIAGIVAVTLLAGCGEKSLDGSKSVATVNGTDISMGLLSLAARRQQAQTEQLYRYFGITGSSIWSGVADEESGETYGDQTVASVLEDLELHTILSQKAADYAVELTEEEKAAARDAAAAFMEANSEEALKALAVTQEQVESYLELEAIEHKMYDAVVADADTDVDKEEAQQSSFTYIEIEKPAEEEAGDGEDAAESDAEEADADSTETVEEAEEAVEEAAAEDADKEAEEAAEETTEAAEEAAAEDAEKEAEEAAEETTEAAEEAAAEETADETEAADDAAGEESGETDPLGKANAILARMTEDPSADMDAVADEIDENLHVHTGTFTTHETDNEMLEDSFDEKVITALRTLSEGQVYDQIIETDDTYYIVRLDKENDEEATQEKIDDMIDQIERDFFDKTTQEWMDAADISVNDKVLKALKITDSHTFTIKEEEEPEEETVDDGTAEEDAEDTTEAADAAEEADAAEAEDGNTAEGEAEKADGAAEEAETTTEETTEEVTTETAKPADEAKTEEAAAAEKAE